MSQAKTPEGPDLKTQGLALDELADGAMVRAHADGEPVLLARRGEEIFAVGAVCTHYGGPLEKGLLDGDSVRCPWHHACFDLRSGAASRAPALDPLPRWEVERREGRVYVTNRTEPGPLAPELATPRADGPRPDLQDAPRKAQPTRIVILGAGAAGAAAAEELRRQGYDGPLVLIDGDADAPYDRPNLSKGYLSGAKEESDVRLRPDGFYERHDIEILRSPAASLDLEASEVRLVDGGSQPYDALLLAMGAEPRSLDVPGADREHVFTLRSFADSRAIAERARTAERAVVVGASFIGLEVAASLRAREVEVDVVARSEVPLGKVFGPALGAMIQRMHEEKGVRFHLGTTVAEIGADEVTLENGQRLPADLVVVGIGVTPRVDLAEAAGLEVEAGVRVDAYLRTQAPGVYAAGDIARWPDPHTGERIRVEHWVLAQRQGRTAARNLLGAEERFEAVPFFWSKHYDLSLRYSGHAEEWDRTAIDGSTEQRACSVAYRREGRTLAVASAHRDLENLKAEVALERDDEAALQRLIGD